LETTPNPYDGENRNAKKKKKRDSAFHSREKKTAAGKRLEERFLVVRGKRRDGRMGHRMRMVVEARIRKKTRDRRGVSPV